MSEAKQATSKQSAISAASIQEKSSSSRVASATARKSREGPKRRPFSSKSMSRMRIRRPSYGFGGVSGIRMMSRSSMARDVEYKRPPLLFLPTYQLEPSLRFHCPTAIDLAEEVIEELFLDHKYNVQESPALAMKMAHEVMRRTKGQAFNRYRIIAVATIGQKRAQCYHNAIAFLWDAERDNYINVYRELTTAFVQITVFGVYLD